jgi:hypothetical protein
MGSLHHFPLDKIIDGEDGKREDHLGGCIIL